MLVACSGEEYGAPERLPVDEGAVLSPQNPYAVSKAAVDLLGGLYNDAHGISTVRTRAFNHAGPGQSDDYVVSAFARQIAEAEAAGSDSVELVTGNLEPRRDFTDVRDVVRAYWLLLEGGEPGVYNVVQRRCDIHRGYPRGPRRPLVAGGAAANRPAAGCDRTR